MNPEFKITEHEPDKVYHEQSDSGVYMSSHHLADFRRCPALYQMGLGKADEDTVAFAFGRAAHAYILEGSDVFNDRYTVANGPVNAKTGKPFGRESAVYKEWYASQANPVVTDDEYNLIRCMRDAVYASFEACDLLNGIKAEVTLRGPMEGVKCQCRFDGITPDGDIIDLKTTNDIQSFDKDFWRFGYNYQAAFYCEMYRLAFGRMPNFYFIAVDKHVPCITGVFKVSDETLGKAVADNIETLQEFKRCEATHNWPTRFEEVRSI